ncbi:S1/P1 nuclease [Frateuria defendens]|uniref:S1/P1 nuclease n=1 Tax=Frateuria defendens TaxID=2219559 RepID=UPI0007DC255E|nr:S1/P1 nuclease [Frateuria defendens]
MRARSHRLTAAILAGALSLAPPLAMAWGPQGHAIVADIAQSHLDPAAAAQVAALLGLEGDTRLDQIASWADGNRKQHPGTGPWHYVDIPLDAAGYDAARDCREADCVVAKIGHFTQVLADPRQAPAARLEALKWVVHFVADVHQPLHASDHGDKGGNTVQEVYFGRGTNLHAMWDGRIIEHALGLPLGPNYSFNHVAVGDAAAQLDAAITPAERQAWAPPGLLPGIDRAAAAWADESHALARTVAYGDLPEKPQGRWAYTYQAEAWPVVQQRLQQAGVRLAELLNEALAGR